MLHIANGVLHMFYLFLLGSGSLAQLVVWPNALHRTIFMVIYYHKGMFPFEFNGECSCFDRWRWILGGGLYTSSVN